MTKCVVQGVFRQAPLLILVYASGLRVSEVVKLKVVDIDRDRMLLNIKGAKGRKDRYTMLSHTALDTLDEYLEKYKPSKWLFEGAKACQHAGHWQVTKPA